LDKQGFFVKASIKSATLVTSVNAGTVWRVNRHKEPGIARLPTVGREQLERGMHDGMTA
jgi:hypothetical protein